MKERAGNLPGAGPTVTGQWPDKPPGWLLDRCLTGLNLTAMLAAVSRILP
jgi:hypothetical protein